jgi:trans-AT polyketide synthase/acyltransferase/oxidoreductase domain-containing protein
MVTPRLVFMFSGQGAQYYGMGQELYEAHPVFRRTLDAADRVVRSSGGDSLVQRLFDGPRNQSFSDLGLSHPAIVAVEFAMYDTLRSEGIVPDLVWGSSLGELVCAALAGCCSYESALRLAVSQARIVTQHCGPGGMLAVLAPPAVLDVLPGGCDDAVMVGENFPGHFTLSAPQEALQRIERSLRDICVSYVRLPVDHAFHSPAVEPARAQFLAACETLEFSPVPRLPVISTMSAGPVQRFTPEYFWEVVTGPMQFRDTLLALEREQPALYIDCGPAGTSATFVKYNLNAESPSQPATLLSPFRTGIRNLEALVAQVRALA